MNDAPPISQLHLGAAIAIGALVAVASLPMLVPALEAASRPEPALAWYVVRASGLVAFVLVWGSMLAGLALSTGAARRFPGPAVALALHRELTVVGLAAAALHAAVLLFDRHAAFDLAAVLVPFAAPLRPAAIAAGQLALYTGVAVAASFAIRRDLGARLWRTLHAGAFAVFAAALVHGLGGTDAAHPAVLATYLIALGSVTFPLVYRLLAPGR